MTNTDTNREVVVPKVVVPNVIIRDETAKPNNCKKCCADCNKRVCGCMFCCIKTWSCCLNGIQGLCNISAAGCMMCSTCCTGCSKCIEEVDCDGK